MSAPIFLYLKSCKLHSDTLKKLRESGYLPIAVESFEDVKIVEPIPSAFAGPIAQAAFASVVAAQYDGVRTDFGKRVAQACAQIQGEQNAKPVAAK